MFYQQIVGSLSFVTHICYDIFVVVNIVNRFLKNSTTNTFQSHSIYFKVHKRDIGLQIFYPQNNYMVLTTHNDFNQAEDLNNKLSTISILVKLGISPIFWSSNNKFTIIPLSNIEAKYHFITNTMKAVVWFKTLLSKLHLLDGQLMTTTCDNQSAIKLVGNHVFHARKNTFKFILVTLQNECNWKFISHLCANYHLAS